MYFYFYKELIDLQKDIEQSEFELLDGILIYNQK